jgi:predicted membrane-bound mannosyltransferase
MSTATSPLPPARPASARLAWALVLVLGAAALLRAWHITTWSMWEDEEGSMTLAQKPYQGFQGFFPVYFVTLHQQMRLTGLSVGAARVFPALMGLLSIALTYFCFRRFTSPQAALLAALLLAVNIGHVFFSQSVRYYTTALVFQDLSLYWFLDGFECDRVGSLTLSVLAFLLGLLTHFSVLLLAPVFVGYLMLTACRREAAAGYTARNYLLFGLMLAAVLAAFAWRVVQLRKMIGGWVIPSAHDPVHVGATFLAYFGVPLVGLGLLAPSLARQLPARVLLFLLCASFIPVLELLVIARMNVVNVTWYYGLVAMVGFALLAGAGLVGLWQRGRRRLAGALAGAALLYYTAFLGGYHLRWHGDRPRWEEAARYLRSEAGVRPGAERNPEVLASVPGVVAFYLGADPRRPETYQVVKAVPPRPAPPDAGGRRWYVVEAKLVSPEYQDWFARSCTLRARFESRTGPVDRSVLVYQYTGRESRGAGSQADSRPRGGNGPR